MLKKPFIVVGEKDIPYSVLCIIHIFLNSLFRGVEFNKNEKKSVLVDKLLRHASPRDLEQWSADRFFLSLLSTG